VSLIFREVHSNASLEQIGTGKVVANENVTHVLIGLSSASLYLRGNRRFVSCGMVTFM
jgi:hypothetical protein